ncbi:MAG TPA: transposase, partial [Pseudonocardiaceae bacterium]
RGCCLIEVPAWKPLVDLDCWEDLGVAKGYRPVRRDQEFLLPPRMVDWLPDDHLVWFVLDVVAELDTSRLHARAARRRDGLAVRSAAGRAGYDPDLLLALLVYAYACGERSSRRIERLCVTDVAFRVICASDVPDHSVLARFRQVHAPVFAELFVQVLRLCRAAGLVQLGTVAIDGTKIAANASPLANRSAAWLAADADRMDRDAAARAADRQTVAGILGEAAEVDAAEDARFGSARGDELPPGWNGPDGRRERIRAAAARLAAAEAEQRERERAAAAAHRERDTAALVKAESALVDARTTQQAKIEEWERAWEHAVTHPGAPVPKGRAPRQDSTTVRRAEQRLAAARERLAHPPRAPRPGRRPAPAGQPAHKPTANITDPDSTIMPTRYGWLQAYNAQFAITADQCILTTLVSTNPNDRVSYSPMTTAAQHTAETTLADPEGIATLLYDAGYTCEDTLAAPTPNRLMALGKTRSVRKAARERPTSGPPPPDATPRQAMDHRLRTPEGTALYTRRGATVEPGIGNLKKLLDRFSRRGLAAVTSELHFTATVFNLLKLHRATHA